MPWPRTHNILLIQRACRKRTHRKSDPRDPKNRRRKKCKQHQVTQENGTKRPRNTKFPIKTRNKFQCRSPSTQRRLRRQGSKNSSRPRRTRSELSNSEPMYIRRRSQKQRPYRKSKRNRASTSRTTNVRPCAPRLSNNNNSPRGAMRKQSQNVSTTKCLLHDKRYTINWPHQLPTRHGPGRRTQKKRSICRHEGTRNREPKILSSQGNMLHTPTLQRVQQGKIKRQLRDQNSTKRNTNRKQ